MVISESTRTACIADKRREGRCSGDYFFLTVCEIHFSGFIEAFDLKGILDTHFYNFIIVLLLLSAFEL